MDLFKLVGTIAIDTANAEKSLNDTKKQLSDTEKAVSDSCDKVEKSSKKAGDSASDAGKKAEEAGKKAKKSGEDAGKGGEETEKSGNKWTAFAKKVEAAGTKVTDIGKKMTDTGKKVSEVGKKFAPLSAAATGALTVVTKTSSDFQNGMAKMSTLFDTSQVSVGKLSKEFLNLSNETEKSATELTEAGYQALSASVPVEKLGNFIKTSANMAKVGFTDTATSVDLLSTAVNAYGLQADQADNIANKLVNTQNLGKTSVNELASSMGKVIPTAAGMNVNLDQLCTMYTLMTKQGIATAESTTYMNSMLNELGDLSTSVGKILNEKTGKSFQELMQEGMSVGDALKIVKQNSDETGTAFNELWGSQEAGKAAMALLNDSAGDFNATMDSMANVTDLVSQGLEKMDTPSAKVTKSLNRIKNSGIGLGSVLLTTVAPYIEMFSEKVIGLTNKFNAMPDSQKKVILALLAIVAAITPVLITVGKVITAFGEIGKVAGKAVTGLGKLPTALSGISVPMVIAVAAIAALVGAFVHLWNTNEDFRNKVVGIWNQIKSSFEGFVNGIKDRLSALEISFSDITSVIKAIWDGFCSLLAPVFVGTFQTIAATIQMIFDVITGILDVFIGVFTGNWSQAWQGVQEIFGGVWDKITSIITIALDTVKGIIDAILGWIGTNLETVWSDITSTIASVWNGIADFFGSIWEGITDTVSSAWETIKNVITVALMLIGEIISAAVQIITLPWRFIWENCKEYIIAAWEAIKSKISECLDTISTVISTVWNAISGVISSVLGTIKGVVSAGWNAIKSVISSVVQAILYVVSSVWNSITGVISRVMSTIRSVMSSGWNAVKSVVSSAINGVKSVISSGMNAASSVVSSILGNIKSKFSSIWNGCKSIVSNAISHIKSAMHFSWSLPKLKLPHPKISGSFSLNPPSVPHFSIDWYAKAMDNAMLLNSPTVFGYSAASGKLLGGGEAGQEVVAGSGTLMEMIRSAVTERNGNIETLLQKILDLLLQYFPQFADGWDTDIILDDGTLVGRVDRRMGTLTGRKGRGN